MPFEIDTVYVQQFYNVAEVDALIAAIDGSVGDPGKSAYELAVEGGFVGDEAQWLNSLKGSDGDDGDDGDDGLQVELQKNATHIQWRYVGAPAWTNLVALVDLKGDTGAPGSGGGMTTQQVKDIIADTVKPSGTLTGDYDGTYFYITGTGAPGGSAYGLWLDDFTNVGDDAKLTAAIAASQNGSVRKPILLSNRSHTFTANRTGQATSGLKIGNPYGFGNQARSANSIPCKVTYNGTGTWWTLGASQVFDVEFFGMGIGCTGTGQTFMTTGSNVLWTSKFSDLGFTEWTGVFGNETSKFLNTACAWDGWGNMNNARGTFMNIGGSDSKISMSNWLIDAGSGLLPTDKYHIILASQQKTHIYGLYITADNVKGIKITGNLTDGALYIHDGEVEGRNAGAPSNELVRIEGATVFMDHMSINFAKAGGYINQTGGELFLGEVKFNKATNTAATAPVLVQTGGTARVSNISTNWGAKAVVQGSNILHDGSVTGGKTYWADDIAAAIQAAQGSL